MLGLKDNEGVNARWDEGVLVSSPIATLGGLRYRRQGDSWGRRRPGLPDGRVRAVADVGEGDGGGGLGRQAAREAAPVQRVGDGDLAFSETGEL